MLWVGSRDHFFSKHMMCYFPAVGPARAKVRSWHVEFVLEEFFGPHRYIKRCIEPVLFLISLHSIVSVLIYTLLLLLFALRRRFPLSGGERASTHCKEKEKEKQLVQCQISSLTLFDNKPFSAARIGTLSSLVRHAYSEECWAG